MQGKGNFGMEDIWIQLQAGSSQSHTMLDSYNLFYLSPTSNSMLGKGGPYSDRMWVQTAKDIEVGQVLLGQEQQWPYLRDSMPGVGAEAKVSCCEHPTVNMCMNN